MFGNKKLLKRIRSLECYLGISYCRSDYRGGNGEHIADEEYGKMYELNKILKKKEEVKKEKEAKRLKNK